MLDHIIYFSSLAACISLGSYYKKIEDLDSKRNYGAGLGILIVCLVCGHYVYHSILMIWGNILIIKCCDKRYIHQMSLAYTWIYLLYLHINLYNTVYVIWIHQTLALRLVGLSFEMYDNEKNKADPKSTSVKINMGDTDNIYSNPTAAAIITYSYFFIGLHKGPYYRWRTFNDHFTTPFGNIGECREVTKEKLKEASVCLLAYILLRLKFSPEIYYEDDFYECHDADYRYLYNVPHLIIYCLQCHILMMFCTSVATECGFGIYPAICQPVPGYGPSTRFSLIKLAISTPDVALQQEYNFSILECYEKEKILVGPKMKDTLRGWDMPTRYWFWANIYKNLVKCNKEIRSALSFTAWTIWIGPSLQQFIISTTFWVHLHLEAEYTDLYNTDAMKIPWNIGFSIMRMFCLIYLTPCLMFDDSSALLKYYHSIFWIYHMVLLVLIIGAVVIYKNRLR